MPQATYSQARKASNELAEKLQRDFTAASSPVNGIGVSSDRVRGHHVVVYMEREAQSAERQNLPRFFKGVPVRYQVIGPIQPH